MRSCSWRYPTEAEAGLCSTNQLPWHRVWHFPVLVAVRCVHGTKLWSRECREPHVPRPLTNLQWEQSHSPFSLAVGQRAAEDGWGLPLTLGNSWALRWKDSGSENYPYVDTSTTSCGIPQVSYACMHALLLPLYPTLWDPMDCSPPGFSARGILQARILGWVAISPPAGIFPTQGSSPHLLRCTWILYHWDTKGAPS